MGQWDSGEVVCSWVSPVSGIMPAQTNLTDETLPSAK